MDKKTPADANNTVLTHSELIAQNAKFWVEALRSGEYTQCSSVLQHPDYGFCCLGVACEVYLKHNPGGITVENETDRVIYGGEYDRLPKVVQEWLGLSTNCGGFEIDNSLAMLNDECGYNFGNIADFIESNPQGLFTS